jgi:hypothetical protein
MIKHFGKNLRKRIQPKKLKIKCFLAAQAALTSKKIVFGA